MYFTIVKQLQKTYLPPENAERWVLKLVRHTYSPFGGVYMRKLAPARVLYRNDFLISYRVLIHYDCVISYLLFEGTLHVDKIHAWFKIANITHALPVPVYRQTDFTPNRVIVSRLHDTVARFNRSEILAPVQQPGWTHAGVTGAGMTFCGGIM